MRTRNDVPGTRFGLELAVLSGIRCQRSLMLLFCDWEIVSGKASELGGRKALKMKAREGMSGG